MPGMTSLVSEGARRAIGQVDLQRLEAMGQGVVIPADDQHIDYAGVPHDGPYRLERCIGNPVLPQQFQHKLDDCRVIGV